MTYDITYLSAPVYDDWGWGDYWSAQDWIAWHRALKAQIGITEANRIFINAYGDAGFGAASYDWRSLNTSFKNYAKANGFYNALFSGVSGLIGSVISAVQTAGTSATDVVETAAETVNETVSNVGKSVTNTTAVLKWVVPVLMLVSIGISIWYITTKKLAK